MKTSFLKKACGSEFPPFQFLIANKSIVVTKQQLAEVKSKMNTESVPNYKAREVTT